MYQDILDKQQLKYCYQCGKCTSGCDVSRLDPTFQPHRLLRFIAFGQNETLLRSDNLWKCTTCFTCSERCPQGIRVTEILWLARVLAVALGCIPASLSAQRDALLKTGSLIPIDNKKREKCGLEAVQGESSVIAKIFEMMIEGRQY